MSLFVEEFWVESPLMQMTTHLQVVIIADPVIAEQLIQIDKGRQIDKLRGPYKNFQASSGLLTTC